jgi:hypothetical protein
MKKSLPVLAIAVLILGACGTARAQAPVPGQPYQVPAGYEAYGAGTLVAYGGYNYVIQCDGTMQFSPPSVPCTQSSTCSQQPATFYRHATQPTASYVYQRSCYRHQNVCHYRVPTRWVSWNGVFTSRGHCHHR